MILPSETVMLGEGDCELAPELEAKLIPCRIK
jgi:hypothetical protein